MRAFRHLSRIGAVCFGLLVLAGCESGGRDIAAAGGESRQASAASSLDAQRITLRAPSEQWRSLRLIVDDAFWSGANEVLLGLGVEAAGAATPYLALGVYASTPQIQGVPVIVFLGFPEGESDGFVLRMSRSEDAEAPDGLRLELVFAFGSNQDPAILHLGRLQSSEPQSGLGLVQALAGRPELAYPRDAGQGGFTGTYARFIDDTGALREIRSGNLQVQTSAPVPTVEGFSVAQTTQLSGQGIFSAGGWYSLAFFAQPETGLQQWALDAQLPPKQIEESGLWVNAGPLQSPVTLELLGLQPAGFFAQGRSDQGPASLIIERTLTGRDGPSNELTPAGLFASWGWISADFEALYGWPMQSLVAESENE